MLIASKTNSKIKQWAKYQQKKYRNQDHKFLIEGYHLIEEADKAGLIDIILLDETTKNPYPQYESYTLTNEVMEKLTMHVSNEHIMAICHMKEDNLNDAKRIVMLDRVQDPGNVGTIIRTAYSFGFDAVILSEDSVDLYNDKVIRSTQGSLFHIPVIQTNLNKVIENCKIKEIPVYGTSLKNALPLSDYEVSDKVALIFGNEGKGVSEEILNSTDKNIFIEMTQFESLNVAIASAICMYKFRK